MIYRSLGLCSNSSFNRLHLAFVQFAVSGQNWAYELQQTATYNYTPQWAQRLQQAAQLSAADYLQLHSEYGHLLAGFAKQFIHDHQLDYRVQLIGNHGLSVVPSFPYQLGDSAAIAALTGVNVVSDFSNIHLALGGNGSNVFAIAKQLLPVTETTNDTDALYTAFIAVLRWREENNLPAGESGATRNSIGGAVWIGQEW